MEESVPRRPVLSDIHGTRRSRSVNRISTIPDGKMPSKTGRPGGPVKTVEPALPCNRLIKTGKKSSYFGRTNDT